MTPEQKELLDALKPLQRKVALNVVSGMSNIDAYYEAGGKAKTKQSAEASVSEILSNLKVKAFLDAMNEAAVNDAIMSRQEMMERLTGFSRTTLHDLIEWAEIESENAEGEPIKQSVWMIKPSAMQDPNKMAAIAELTAGKEGIKIKTHSPLSAMKQLAELAGYNAAQKHELSNPDGSLTPRPSTIQLVAPPVDNDNS